MYLYVQIADDIREFLAESRPGAAIPSETEFVDRYGASRETIRRALRILKDEGVIYTVTGTGTFVGPETAPRTRGGMYEYQRIAHEIIAEIQAGDLKPNRPIPSLKTLVQRYDVAVGTAQRAVAHLRELGWIITMPQRGSFVRLREDWPKTTLDAPEV